MKIKKKSIIIPAFALLIGASLAGSISGTIAWYQFSTRVTAAYVGVSGGTSENLKIRLGTTAEDNEWLTRLTIQNIKDYVDASDYGSKVMPITAGALDKDSALGDFYLNPVYGQGGEYANWQKAGKENYVKIPLQLCYVQRDGVEENGEDAKYVAKEVFLSDLLIQEDKANHEDANDEKLDLSDAVRFHICAYQDDAQEDEKVNRLISKKGGTTLVEGQLDLDGDGELDYVYDSDKYGFGGDDTTPVVYGEGEQVAFYADETAADGVYYDSVGGEHSDANLYSMIVENVDDSLDILESSKEYAANKSKAIGMTTDNDQEFLNVEITIWIEGWQAFKNANNEYSSVWSEDYLQSHFDVGFEFAVDPVEQLFNNLFLIFDI